MSKTVTIPVASKSFIVPHHTGHQFIFLLGFPYGLVDVLNKHFQDALHISKTKSTLLQLALLLEHIFLAAVPAALFMSKFDIRKASSWDFYYTPLVLSYAIPAQQYNFNFFLISFLFFASGITCFETAPIPISPY